MKLIASFCLALLFGITTEGVSQGTTGTISGTVRDGTTGALVSDVAVQVTGTRLGVMTDENGQFVIRDVPAGNQGLTIKRLGFAPTEVNGITVVADSTVVRNVTLSSVVAQLQAQRITAATDRGTVAVALEQQRTAPAIVNAITSEQISKSPDGDAAQAVQRVSGVTVQDGKYVFVRGLGERYTTTSLNGARIPSPEPERRVVPLDLFPSSLLQGILTSKTFTPDKPGDFGGATVDIQMKDFPLRRVLSYSTSTGFNSIISGRSMIASPRSGAEWLGFGGGRRALPGLVQMAATSDTASRATVNSAIRSLRNTWSPQVQRIAPNYSFAASMGGNTDAFNRRVGYLLSGTYSSSFDARKDEVRSLAIMPDHATGELVPFSRFSGASTVSSVLWGGLFNASTLIGDRTRLLTNNMYNRGADNEGTQLFGRRDQDDNMPTRRTMLRYVERSMRSNQLKVEHMFSDRNAFNLAVTFAGVKRNEPDRTEMDYIQERDIATGELMPYALFIRNLDGARKTFAGLNENSINLNLDYNLWEFKFGAALRRTSRNADNSAFSIINNFASGSTIPRALLELDAEDIFNSETLSDTSSYFALRRNTFGGRYTANDMVSSAYAMMTQPLGERLQIIGGVRLERTNMTVRSASTSGEQNVAKRSHTDILPALNLQYELADGHQIRMGLSQTVSRPEYREISPIEYRDMVEQRTISGNADLKQSRISNLDLRWEWYPTNTEIMSIGVFAKQFSSPIERVEIATSGASRLGFINADGGYNYGVEFELRRQLSMIADVLSPLTAFTNVTLMKSQIDMKDNNVSAFTDEKRPMIGQAPYVLNAGLNYAHPNGRASASILYNVVGKRLQAGGIEPLPDTYELPRQMVDLSLQMPLFSRVNAKLDLKNLLDSPFRMTQGDVTRAGYKSGRGFSLGFRWEQ